MNVVWFRPETTVTSPLRGVAHVGDERLARQRRRCGDDFGQPRLGERRRDADDDRRSGCDAGRLQERPAAQIAHLRLLLGGDLLQLASADSSSCSDRFDRRPGARRAVRLPHWRDDADADGRRQPGAGASRRRGLSPGASVASAAGGCCCCSRSPRAVLAAPGGASARGDALRLVQVATLRPARLRDRDHVRARPAVRRRAARSRPRPRARESARRGVPGHPRPGDERRRAGPALAGIQPDVRQGPALLRRLHRPQRRHARRPLPLRRDEGDPLVGAAAAVREGLRRQSQRRPAAVRAGRLALVGQRRRRRRRRPRVERAEPRAAVRQADAPGRRRPTLGLAARRLRAAEPLAVLVRPRERRPLHRRRRSERLGGDRLPPARVRRRR